MDIFEVRYLGDFPKKDIRRHFVGVFLKVVEAPEPKAEIIRAVSTSSTIADVFLGHFKQAVPQVFLLQVFSQIMFPKAPENSISGHFKFFQGTPPVSTTTPANLPWVPPIFIIINDGS